MFDFTLALNKTDLLASLDILWKGMLGIFVVMALIFVSIKLLNFFTNKERVKAFIAKMKKSPAPQAESDVSEQPKDDE